MNEDKFRDIIRDEVQPIVAREIRTESERVVEHMNGIVENILSIKEDINQIIFRLSGQDEKIQMLEGKIHDIQTAIEDICKITDIQGNTLSTLQEHLSIHDDRLNTQSEIVSSQDDLVKKLSDAFLNFIVGNAQSTAIIKDRLDRLEQNTHHLRQLTETNDARTE